MDVTTRILQSISINGLLMAAGQHPKILSRRKANMAATTVITGVYADL